MGLGIGMSDGGSLVGACFWSKVERGVEWNLLASNKMLRGFEGVLVDWVGARFLVRAAVALVGGGCLVNAGFSG